MRFRNRRAAGRRLAQALQHHAGTGAIVLGLPRGGVPVAVEVARALDATLDVCVVRKLGVPFQPELGMGAIAEGPRLALHPDLARRLGIEPAAVRAIARREADEVRRRVERFRRGGPPAEVRGRTVILVDDGIATGGTMRAAIRATRKRGAAYIVVAVPVASYDIILSLRAEVDEIVCLYTPPELRAVGLWYEDFDQVSDGEVIAALDRARAPAAMMPAEAASR
jgi:putative phosphoribosyl transferase